MHALINVHEYHCIAIRMRCWLVDDSCFCSILLRGVDIYASRVGHVQDATTNTKKELQ